MQYLIPALLVIGLVILLTRWLIHRAYRAPRVVEHRTPGDLGLPFTTIRISGSHGKALFGWFVAAGEEPAPVVAIMHGWGGNAELMLPFAQLLHQAGYATLLLDARNHGQSDSDDYSSMPRFAEDLECGLGWLKQQPQVDTQRCYLLGHSVGAAAALLLASRRHDVAGVVSIAAFAHPARLMRRQMRAHHIPYHPIGWLILRYVEWTIGFRFDEIAPCNTIRQITCPVLLVHGEADNTVPPQDAQVIYANRPGEQVELLLIPNTGHDSRDSIMQHGEALIRFLDKTQQPSQV